MDNDVSKLEYDLNNKETNSKCITNTSFVMDINILKAPLFLYNNYKPVKDENGNILTQVEERTYNWIDSRNMNRRLYMYCKGRLPRQFESDTIHGLIGLFIKKHAPFPFNHETKQYEINVSKLEYSWYELCEFMNIPSTGYYIERLKEAIRILKQTQYFSYENGVIYDKSNQRYLRSGEEGMSLITKYKFKTNKKVTESDEYAVDIDSNYVIFDELILNNLRHEYLKYLDIEMFFSKLPSGIGRGIYGYLEANRYDGNGKPLKYIKRKFDTLRIGIPVDFNYPYELKNKLKKPLKHMMKIGYMRDFAFGDELQINGEKEQCVYFCFGITSKELKSMLEKKNAVQLGFDFIYDDEFADEENNESKLEKSYLKLPAKSLEEELIDRKVEENFARSIATEKDKWTIIKYILWADKQLETKKGVRDIGAILSFALRRVDDLPLSHEYDDIIKFVEEERLKEEGETEQSLENLRKQYQEYIRISIEEYQLTPDYEIIKEMLIADIENSIDRIILQNKSIGNDISKFEEFKIYKEKSDYFNEIITKEIKAIRKLMTEQEFIDKKLYGK